MTRRCIIEGCTSKSGNPQHRGVTFHSFPFESKTRDIWLSNCRIDPEKNITKSVLVCSRHFRRADFQPAKSNKYLLRQGAVPTIFPWGKLSATTDDPEASLAIALQSEMDAPAGDDEGAATSIGDVSAAEKVVLKRPSDDTNQLQIDPKMPRLSSPPSVVQVAQDIQTLIPITALPAVVTSVRKTETVSGFVPGVRLEAQDFDGNWHPARVVEVDNDEREILIRFEKTGKAKGLTGAEEWIPMNSSRLRQKAPLASKSPNVFVLGEKCLARWSGSRRFPATIHKVLGDDTYEILFDDGYMKVLKSTHISKMKVPKAAAGAVASPQVAASKQQSIASSSSSSSLDKAKPKAQPAKKDWPLISISSLNLTELNLPDIPKDGEWCCHWVNDQPIGREGFLTVGDHKKPTVIVDDWRLPPGWTKHMYQRSNVLGKWDVILVNSGGKRFRSKADLKQYLEDLGQQYNPDIYDFSIHRRRAKDIGAYAYTKDYKPPPPVKSQPPPLEPLPQLQLPQLTTPQNTGQTPSIESLLQGAVAAAAANFDATPAKLIEEEIHPVEDGFVYVGSLKVQIVDNLFRCPKDGCNKNFRKENHLQIHIKHYHEDIAKFLGECPNMQELACKRTIGHPPDEPLPKNYLPNSQYFAKLHQQDLQTRLHRKSTSAPMTPTISTPPHPGSVDSFIDSSKILDISEIPSTSSIFNDNLATSSSTLTHPTGDETITSAPIEEPPKPKPVTQPRPHSKPGRKPAAERKSSRQRLQKKYPRSTGAGLHLNDSSFQLNDFEETRHSFNGTPEQKISKKARLSHPTFVQDSIIIDGNTTGSIPEQSSTMIVGQSPKYIQENGEYIKIVRMRSEEIINCLCSFGEEDGLMIQCELCLCWQHGICNGIERESQVPEKYVCYICKNPTLGRPDMKYIHDQDWLYDGKLPIGYYHAANPRLQDRFNILRTSHTLTGNLCELKRFLHSLRVKINIAENKDHPKMYLWAKKWESSPPQLMETKVEKFEPSTAMDDKDQAKKESDGSEEQGGDIKIEEKDMKQESPTKIKHDVSFNQPNIPQPEAAIDSVECQHRLLEHIQKQQSLVMERLQDIESDIAELESLDPSSEFDTSEKARTNQAIALLIRDLENMQNVAKINAVPPSSYAYA